MAVDAAAINGLGLASNQPLGLLQTPGVPSYSLAADSGNGGVPAYADAVGMEEAAANLNADSEADARMGWLTSPNGRSKLRRTDSSAAVSGTSGRWVWRDDQNTVISYPAMATTNVPSNTTKGAGPASPPRFTAIGGIWSVNLFSAVDILYTPFTITSRDSMVFMHTKNPM